MSDSKEYGSETRYWNEKFGRGSYDSFALNSYRENTERETALRLGWSNGCPVAQELTSPDSQYDLDWMINRYAQTNEWYRAAVYQARGNKAVQDWLTTPKLRLASEPVGKHESQSVPKSHQWKISPMSGVDGYATPRVAIEIRNKLGGDEDQSQTYDLLWDIAKATGNTPGIYLALLSEAAVHNGVEPERVLHHVYPAGLLREENCRIAFWDLARSLEQHAPTIWRTYLDLPQGQKTELEIADVPQLA